MQNTIFSNTKQFRAMVSVDDVVHGLSTHYWTCKIQDGRDPPSWKSTRRHFFLPWAGPIWIKFLRLVQNDMATAVMWSKLKPE